MTDIPPLPAGFQIEPPADPTTQPVDQPPAATPALPEGFVLEAQQADMPTAAPEKSGFAEGMNKVNSALNLISPLGWANSIGQMLGKTAYDAAPGIADSAASAVSAPYRAMTGDLRLTDDAGNVTPEAIGESTNIAGWIMPTTAMKLRVPVPSANEVAKQTVVDVTSKFARPGNQVGLAAERIGVELPRAITTDSKIVQSLGKGLENQPLIGNPLLNANEKALSQIEGAVKGVQNRLGTGDIPNAGAQARAQFTDYSKNTLREAVDKRYDAVNEVLTPNVTTPLKNTANYILERRISQSNATTKEVSGLLGEVNDALNTPGGLNYDGIKDLRTRIGDKVDGPSLAQDRAEQKALKGLYAALSEDLRDAAVRAGGDNGLAAFEKANSFAAKVAADREKLQSILGTKKSDENVFGTIYSLATTANSRADINKLFLARKAVDKETWDEVASGVISNMGRDGKGNFSPDRFLTDYGKISPTGKAMLFNTTGKKDLPKILDDIRAVAERTTKVNKNFGNPSGTARGVGWAALGGAITHAAFNPASIPPMAAGAIGGNLLAKYLAKPETAKTVLDYLKAAELAQSRPSVASNQLFSAAATKLGQMAAIDMGKPETATGLISQLITGKAAAGDQQNDVQPGQPVGQDQGYTPDQQFEEAYRQGRAT